MSRRQDVYLHGKQLDQFLEAAVKRVLEKLSDEAEKADDKEWLETTAAERKLGLNPGTLNRKRKAGWLYLDVHYMVYHDFSSPTGTGVRYKWKVAECGKIIDEREAEIAARIAENKAKKSKSK